MKITCDVIQDLMPSYIDGILSEDSRALVEEHMGTCQECRKMLEIMKEEQGKEQNQMRSSAATLKKIRKKLIVRRVLTATVAVILTLIVAAAGYNHWYFNEKYMTLEDSGMYVKDNCLYSSNNLINRMKVQYTEDGKTEFVYAIDAPYAGTLELKGDDMLLQDFSKKTKEAVTGRRQHSGDGKRSLLYERGSPKEEPGINRAGSKRGSGCSGENCG